MVVPRQVFSDLSLLSIPTKRAAWSDRTALLMSEMSKLAYYGFEKGADNQVMTQAELDGVLSRLLSPGVDDEGEPDQLPDLPECAVTLQEDLARGGFELAGIFSDEATDTQAFLAISTSGDGSSVQPFGDEDVVILSFRGTKSLKDWLTNINIIHRKVSGVEIHSGFQAAFDAIESSIRKKLDPLLADGHTLYLTGHSLGGALALIATREIGPGSRGASYTFGSPRVARFGFARFIKTPIYRVVNSNDLVPRIPPAYIPTILLFVLRFLNFPAIGLLRGLIGKITKYVHHGDMRFIRRAKIPYDNLQVLSNPSVIYRFFWYWPALIANWRSPAKDHSIDVYREKLAAYAASRLGGGFV